MARRHRTGDASEPDDETRPEVKPGEHEGKPESAADLPTQPVNAPNKAADKDLPEIEPPPPKGEPWPDATPEPMRPVRPETVKTDFDDSATPRTRTETVLMPTVPGQYGAPPAMPRTSAPPPLTFGAVEDPTHMPGPRDIPGGDPEDPAPAPGKVPPGDSRSLRRADEFALVYRIGTYVISRFGTVGQRGIWRVVEYPTSSSASHSYAKECSRFVSDGFSDYRE